jgi:hypothetical protein
VSPYFHVLTLFKSFWKSYFRDPAIFKSFPRKVHPILLIQECKQLSLSITTANKLIKLSSLTYYVMIATNKRCSYSRVTAIRIDIHPTGINPTNTPHAFHARSTYSNLSRVTYKFEWILLLSRKRALDTIHSTPADRSMDPYPVSLPCQPMKQ